jgi:protein-tyrosine-phosphatase
MMSEKKGTLIAICDKFPDFFEVYQEDENSPPTILFVCTRKNGRSFVADHQNALRWLEAAGNNIKVRIGTMEMSLDEFEQNGAIGATASRPLAQSTYYAKRLELKRLVQAYDRLTTLDEDQRPILAGRISQLRRMLGLSEDALTPQSEIRRSDQQLNRVIGVLQKQPDNLEDYKGGEMEWPSIFKIRDERLRVRLSAEKQISGTAKQHEIDAFAEVVKGYYNKDITDAELKTMYTKAIFTKPPEQGDQNGTQPTTTNPDNVPVGSKLAIGEDSSDAESRGGDPTPPKTS